MKFPLTFFIAFLAYTPLWFVVAVKAAVSLITNKCGYISVESFGLVFVLVLEVFGILCVWSASKKDFSEKAKANPPNKYKMLSCQEQKTVTIRFIVENILHNRYAFKQVINEWYELDDENVKNFREKCKSIEEIIEVMKDNHFFRKKYFKD
jgi:hypothetical protein